MTKKHYIAVAQAVRALRPADLSSREGRKWQKQVGVLADKLTAMDQTFNRDLFEAACAE